MEDLNYLVSYIDLLEKIHSKIATLYKKSDVVPEQLSSQLQTMITRLSAGEDPTSVITDAMAWITQEAMEDSISKGFTAQKAMEYMSSANIPKQIIEAIQNTWPDLAMSQSYISIVESINWPDILTSIKDQLFNSVY